VNEEEEMAKFFVEDNPNFEKIQLQEENVVHTIASERERDLQQENVLKGLLELCLLRCIRPEKMIESVSNFLSLVIDTKYVSFQNDILAKYIKVEKLRISGGAKASFTK